MVFVTNYGIMRKAPLNAVHAELCNLSTCLSTALCVQLLATTHKKHILLGFDLPYHDSVDTVHRPRRESPPKFE